MEMVLNAARAADAVEGWAEERETKLTEELDAHLRAHRPRAGRVEEDTRLARSVGLVAQRRRVEGHLRAQSKDVHAQAVSLVSSHDIHPSDRHMCQACAHRLRCVQLLFCAVQETFVHERHLNGQSSGVHSRPVSCVGRCVGGRNLSCSHASLVHAGRRSGQTQQLWVGV